MCSTGFTAPLILQAGSFLWRGGSLGPVAGIGAAGFSAAGTCIRRFLCL
ncbi:hypothetical protein L21SP2_1183 [Salinispira pacifica]|uniref:Uncharacterized protein n=1 Tax=Salinispira pacifica TaxID=1307761 RepID=V5WHE8_9SPIO|nr:hypothetical protein L21SP2_1183 [Salinispira pacifica]